MRLTFLQIAGSAVLLLLAGLWPRAGHPVLLVLAPGEIPAAAFATEGWRIQSVRGAGPLPLLLAAPDSALADLAVLRHAAGAVLAVGTRAMAGCSPFAPES